jgi:hypothetical protein
LKGTNGLTTVKGLTTNNGLTVNCAGKTYPSQCTGEPDGVLSASTGLMTNEDGVDFASYLIRCALPSTSTIEIKKWDGALVALPGEVGMAPEWEEGQCDEACQEKVSACLLALTNDSGAHVTVEVTAPWHNTGTNHEWTVSEAVFYGNLFLDPPEAYMAAGSDYAQTLLQASAVPNEIIATNLMPRSCSAVTAMTYAEFAANQDACPITLAGSASTIGWSGLPANERNRCTLTATSPGGQEGTATKCLSPGPNGTTWDYPITTWLSEGWDSMPSMSSSKFPGSPNKVASWTSVLFLTGLIVV